MGFSLSRALQGAVVGAAHEAGEVFDGMIAEERKTRELEAATARTKELQVHQSDLLDARERSRDELKDARAKADRDTLSSQMKDIRAKVRETGEDPDSVKGLKLAAGFADEAGYTAIADKYRGRGETERSHIANEENRKEMVRNRAEARAGRKREGMDAEDKAAMNGIIRQVDRLVVPGTRDENGKTIGDPDKDAAQAGLAWAEDQRDKGRSWKSIRSDLAQITEGYARQPDEIKKLPSMKRFDAALGYWNLPEDKRKELTSKPATTAPTTLPTPGAPKKPNTGGGALGWLGRAITPSEPEAPLPEM